MAILSDLLRVVALALFGVCAFYVREIGKEVKDIRRDHGGKLEKHGERIARLEGANGSA